jgi:palmitoyltransferase
MVQFLISEGSNLSILANNGMSCIHLAAKSNNMQLLCYLKDQGLSIVSVDEKGATPLHWASFFGCELTVLTLVSWSVSVNSKDLAGLTPLHLASINGNSQLVRILLLNGADPFVSDAKGRTPTDFAKDYGFQKVLKALAEPGWITTCGLRAPTRKTHSNCRLFMLFLTLLLVGSLLKLLVVEVDEGYYLGVMGLQWVFTVFIAFKDPGVLPRNMKTLQQLCNENEAGMVCPSCVTQRKPRTIHCQVCNRCVEKFDHHCPWINNCIGAKNIGFFYLFIICTAVFLIASLYQDLEFIFDSWDDFYNFDDFQGDLPKFALIVSIIVLVLVETVFLILVSLLIFIQSGNLASGMTTNERFSHYTDEESQAIQNGCLLNCFSMCCDLNPSQAPLKEKQERLLWKLDDIERDFKGKVK